MTDTTTLQTEQVLATLHDLMTMSESDTACVQAAKILLERLAPKEDDEARRRESDEPDHALAEARGLLAEFADLRFAGLCGAGEMADAGPAAADHAATDDTGARLAHLADQGRAGLGKNADGG